MSRTKPSSDDALFRAVKKRDIKLVRKLLADGANPNAAQNSDYVGNFTILMHAASSLFLDGVKDLLKAGADVNLKRIAGRGDKGGNTALHDVLSGSDFSDYDESGDDDKRLKIVEVLLEAGADVNAIAQEDTLPLYTAAEEGNLKIVKCLVVAGANPAKWPPDCHPPLAGAANGCHLQIARFLIERGALVDCPPEDVTPLMTSAYRGCETLVEFFIAKGANVNHRAKDGRTPILSAALFAQDAFLDEEQECAIRIFKMLTKAGADLKVKNVKGETALEIASRCENLMAADFLRGLVRR